MKLFIIGNGFDLAHGLPTSYWDFRTYLESVDWDFLEEFERHYDIYPETREEAKRVLLWNELETNLANIEEDYAIENAEDLDLGLEGGDIGCEDTMYYWVRDEYDYIFKLPEYLEGWVQTIQIDGTKPRTSFISNDDEFLNFNYTDVLERVYGIEGNRILHIHGSLDDEYEDKLILGHGNHNCIERVAEEEERVSKIFDEKRSGAYRALEEYYKASYKNPDDYSYKFRFSLSWSNVDEIIIIGHSLAGVDLKYFSIIDEITGKKLMWKVYFFKPTDKTKLKNNLVDIGISENRVEMLPSSEFYDL